ncbi:MAG TPA: alginate lyase family protein [Holophaga sp.]|nr:alginate lyase family protein [Holophaga sp.]
MRAALIPLLLALPLWPEGCPPPPAGIADIRATNFYIDAAHSVADPARLAEYRAQAKPFEAFRSAVMTFTDAFLEDGSRLDCAIAYLRRWASDRAMLGELGRVNGSSQSQYVREWTLGSLAISWNKIRVHAPAEERALIDGWLRECAHAGIAYKAQHLKGEANNHLYWGGVADMAVGVATGDQVLLDEARRIYRQGISDIQEDGVLPQEMKRGCKALHYHAYAEMALVLIAEMSRKVGENWYADQDFRLNRLSRLVAAGIRNPSIFVERTGGYAPQEPLSEADLAWVAFVKRRIPSGEAFDGIAYSRKAVGAIGGKARLMMEKGVFDPR